MIMILELQSQVDRYPISDHVTFQFIINFKVAYIHQLGKSKPFFNLNSSC